MEYYTAERKEEFLPFATAWMELESIMLSEISQAVKCKSVLMSVSSSVKSEVQTSSLREE